MAALKGSCVTVETEQMQYVCDIIIPVWNRIDEISLCLESVFSQTLCRFRVIIIDDYSDRQTSEYLERFARQHESNTILIKNNTNRGYIKSINTGMKASSAEFVCLLNSDTIVAEGWLRHIMALANSSPLIGIINPNSNNSGLKMEGICIADIARKCAGGTAAAAELAAASGFCMVIKREVIDRIGFFDEIFGAGFFEDTDYSFRARHAGYLCIRALRSFVWHKQHASFNQKSDWEKTFNRNRDLFEKKWRSTGKHLVLLKKTYSRTSCCILLNWISQLLLDGKRCCRCGK